MNDSITPAQRARASALASAVTEAVQQAIEQNRDLVAGNKDVVQQLFLALTNALVPRLIDVLERVEREVYVEARRSSNSQATGE